MFTTSTLFLKYKPETCFKVIAPHLYKDIRWLKYESIWGKGRKNWSRKGFYAGLLDSNLCPGNLVQIHYTPLTKRHSVGEKKARLGH